MIKTRGYVTALSLIAAAILILGVVFRPDRTPPPVVSEGERIQLQVLAQRQSLQRRRDMLALYAREVAPAIDRVRSNPGTAEGSPPQSGEMLVIVARNGTAGVNWTTADIAGTRTGDCGVHELTTTALIPETLEHGVAFNLNGAAVALVTRCGERLVLASPRDYAQFEKQREVAELWKCCGLRLEGNHVVELRNESLAARAGIELGDEIAPSTSGELTRALIGGGVDLEVRRSGRPINLPALRTTFRRTSGGVEVLNVPPGSPAARAGLLPGDVILRAGDVRRPAVSAVERALSEAAIPPLAVLRGDRSLLLEVRQ